MHIQVETFTVHKRFALTISRCTTVQTTNVWLRIESEGIEGWGEASPFSTDHCSQTTESILKSFLTIKPILEKFHPLDRQQIEQVLTEYQLPSAVKAAIDVALYDWLGKKVGLPLWRLWGLNCNSLVPISVTIGINSPEGAINRVRDWLQFAEVKFLKVKLGNPTGIDADQAMLMAIKAEAPQLPLMVDANGGWSLAQAIKMSDWLATQGVKYIEQPLATGNEEQLIALYHRSPLPIFVDESCWISSDIIKLADRVHGINIKLMKAGGLTEIIRMIHIARACGLQVMFGCYSDSVIANSAIAQLSPLADYLDLDSHLNLIDDPFTGALMQQGCLVPNDLPGLGVRKISTNQILGL